MPGAPPRVFLSYARKDGESFATALRHRLTTEQPEITLWQDLAEEEGGRNWWTQIETALDQVTFLVIVVTPDALRSKMVEREWRYARTRGVIVYPVKGVLDNQLEETAIPRWMMKAHWFDLGRWTGEEWQDVKQWETFTNYLKSDRQPVRVPFLAPDLPQGFVPRPTEFDAILQQVLDPARTQPIAIITALQGAGGYGKTTLAIALCHDERVSDSFDDGVLWASVGETPRVVDELARWYEALTGHRPAFVDARDAASKLADKLEHRNCLLVIDDVWERRHLEPFLEAGKHSTCVITTRRVDLVHDAARIRVDEMTANQSVRLLTPPREAGEVSDIRLSALARQLGEWPLLLSLVASQIHSRLRRGDSAEGAVTYVERALQKRGVTAFDQRDPIQRHDAIRRTIETSLDAEAIWPDDRARFQDLAIFPEDTPIPLTTLARLWGLDDLDTEDCGRRLDDVALVALDLRRGVVTVHDVMRAYLRQPGRELAPVHARLVDGYGDLQQLPDAYAWQWVPYHFAQARRLGELRTLLLTPRWLEAQLHAVGPYAVTPDFAWIQGDHDLELIHDVLRLALPALASDPSQFCEQAWGRLPVGVSDAVDRFRSALPPIAPLPRLHARWPNLQGPVGALRQTLPHEREVIGALVLPDERVLSWSADRTLRVWDLATGAGRPLTGHNGPVTGALLMPDGRVLSWSDDATLRVWDLATGAGRPLTGHNGAVTGALLMPDGRVLSWSKDATLRVWDLATGAGRPLTGHNGLVTGALVLPDGRLLSWSEDRTLRVWNLATAEGHPLTGHEASVDGALVLSDGRLLSWSADTTLRLWDLATGAGRPLTGHNGLVTGALVLPDGRVLSWSADRTLRVWDLATGAGAALRGHEGKVTGALLMADGLVLSWSDDATLRVWDRATGAGRSLTGHEAWVTSALIMSDRRVLSWSGDHTLRVWDLATGAARPLIGHDAWVTGALVLRDGRVLSWSIDGSLHVWDLATGAGRPLTGHEGKVTGALLMADGLVLSWSDDATLRVWDRTTGAGRPLTGHGSPVDGALVLPDGRALSWSSDTTLRVWDLATGEGCPLTGHESWVTGALVLPDGRVLSWSRDRTLRVWDWTTGEGRPLTGHEGWVVGALVLPDRRLLSWSADHTLRVWDLATGEGCPLSGHEAWVDGALVLPDGQLLSWSADHRLRVWNLATGEGHPLTGHEASVNGALVLPDGHLLSWSADHTLRVWNLATGEGYPLTGHEASVEGALLLSDGRLLSWSRDATLWVWDLATGAGRPLTGHNGRVTGALVQPDGRVLSWSRDHTLRLQTLERPETALAFWFDATPTAVLPIGLDQIWVGDALGRVHVLELLNAPS